MKDEIARRHRYTDDVIALFQRQPRIWIPVADLAKAGGFCAWRTRVSEARKLVEKDGGVIEWNGKVLQSAYRYLPYTPISASHEASGQRRFSLT